ncbi:MAG TPA: CBS domain-containing protein [Kofleriaceae bacterium]
MMPTVDLYMTPAPYCVTPTDDVGRARELMDRHRFRHLPVVDGTELVGVVLRRDLVAIENRGGPEAKAAPVTQAMRPALSVSSNMTLDEAVDLMIEHDLDCLVVRAPSGVITGILTAIDALKVIDLKARQRNGAPSKHAPS